MEIFHFLYLKCVRLDVRLCRYMQYLRLIFIVCNLSIISIESQGCKNVRSDFAGITIE